MARTKRLSKQNEMMRRDGLVTAVEVSEATGLALSAVHRGIEEGYIPGRTVQVSEKYNHHYVDIKAYLGTNPYAGMATIQDNLKKLLSAVADAKRSKAIVSTPRSTS